MKYIAKKKNRNTLEGYLEVPSSIQDGTFCANSQRLPTVIYFRKFNKALKNASAHNKNKLTYKFT